jgi:hypothetical protein
MYACRVALVETFEKNCVNPFSNSIQGACSGLRLPPVTLKVVPKAGCDPVNCFEIFINVHVEKIPLSLPKCKDAKIYFLYFVSVLSGQRRLSVNMYGYIFLDVRQNFHLVRLSY